MATTVEDEQDFTPEQLEDTLEGEIALPTAGMHGEELGDGLDPDALEEVADLEAVAAGEPPAAEIGDAVVDRGAGDEVAAIQVEPEEDQEDAEPDLGALLTGMLVPEPEAGVADDDERDVSGLEIEYVPTARGNEFVCSACFLIWNRRHLADPDRKVCRDCIDDVAPATPSRAAAA